MFGLLVFAILAAAALFTLWLHPHLPEHYRSAETTSNLRLGMGVIATITAVVLGLLISSVRGSFDIDNKPRRSDVGRGSDRATGRCTFTALMPHTLAVCWLAIRNACWRGPAIRRSGTSDR